MLLAAAPHIMRPLRFVMPHAAHLRPAWMIRAGLFLYDHLARRSRLAASAAIDLRTHIAGEPLQARYRRGFVYSDGQVDDARLVVLNALDAQARGATHPHAYPLRAARTARGPLVRDARDAAGERAAHGARPWPTPPVRG